MVIRKMSRNKNNFFQIIFLIVLIFLIYLQITAIEEYSSNPTDKDSLISLVVYSSLLLLFILITSFQSSKKRKKRNLYGQPIEEEDEEEEKIQLFDTFQQKQLMTKYEEKIDNLRPIKKPILSQCPNCKFLITANMKKCPNCGINLY
jgi:hypothetical protein